MNRRHDDREPWKFGPMADYEPDDIDMRTWKMYVGTFIAGAVFWACVIWGIIWFFSA
jgi:hypothetical protein